MEKSTVDDTVDRISQLPDSIIHHILSYFSDDPETLVRVSVLSKNWFSLTASLPILKFNELRLRENLFNYAKYTMSRIHEENVSPHTLDICASRLEPAHEDIVDKCVSSFLRKGVQVLSVSCWGLRLPTQLLSASSLLSLTIDGCELPSSLMVDTLTLTSLKLLSLQGVRIDDEVITYLTASCPVLEDINLVLCHGYQRVCVYAHQTLQKVQIRCGYPIDRIDIEAPNLRYLLVVNEKGLKPASMNLASCEKIKTFCYCGDLSERHFPEMLSSFRFIQNLLLCCRSSNYKQWRLSVPSLRSLELQCECDLDEIDINAPNLLLFEYCSYDAHLWDWRLSTPFRKEEESSASAAHPTALFMRKKPSFDDVDAIWFEKLRFFLGKYQGIQVLKLHICANEDGINAKELMGIKSPPYELKHLLVTLYDLQDFEDVVDALLWCCRPLSLTLRLQGHMWLKNQRLHRLKYAYEKLLKQEEDRAGQFNIRIVFTDGRHSIAKQHFTDLNSLAAAIHRDYGSTITFIKEKAGAS